MADVTGIKTAFIHNGQIAFSFKTGDLAFAENGSGEGIDFDGMLHGVYERIDTGQRPAGTLSKALERIAHHTEQLEAAVLSLCETYGRMINVGVDGKVQRTSAVVKARRTMLEAMPDKVLKDVAKLYLPDTIDDFILPDDRAQLIKDTVAAMGGVEIASVG